MYYTVLPLLEKINLRLYVQIQDHQFVRNENEENQMNKNRTGVLQICSLKIKETLGMMTDASDDVMKDL